MLVCVTTFKKKIDGLMEEIICILIDDKNNFRHPVSKSHLKNFRILVDVMLSWCVYSEIDLCLIKVPQTILN